MQAVNHTLLNDAAIPARMHIRRQQRVRGYPPLPTSLRMSRTCWVCSNRSTYSLCHSGRPAGVGMPSAFSAALISA